MTTYYEDPTGLTRIVEYAVPEEDVKAHRRAYAERVADEVDAILDWAVGTDRPDRARRVGAEALRRPRLGPRDARTSHPARAGPERAFAQDARIRSLSDQNLAMLGIERRPVEYEADTTPPRRSG